MAGSNASPSSKVDPHLIRLYVKESNADSLELSPEELGMKETDNILESLSNSETTQLSLSKNDFTGRMEMLSGKLVKSNVKKLYLSDCKLSNDDFSHLMKNMNQSQITELSLSGCNLKLDKHTTDVFVNSLQNLTRLDFNDNHLDPIDGVAQLAEALPTTAITHLRLDKALADEPQCDISLLFANLRHTEIVELSLSENKLSLSNLMTLSESLKGSKITSLDLSDNGIDDNGVNVLVPGLVLSQVSELDLGSNQIQGYNSLGQHIKKTRIKSLSLSFNPIESTRMFSFPNFFQGSLITHLDLEDCMFGDEIGAELIRNLKNSNVQRLNLSNSDFSEIFELAEIIEFTNLTHLSVGSNTLEIADFHALGDSIQRSKLEYIDLSGCLSFFTKLEYGVAEFIGKTKGSRLDYLDLSVLSLKEGGARIIAPKLINTTFTHLSLSANSIKRGAADLTKNLKFTAITHLDLSDNKMKDQEAILLAVCLKDTQIVELNVGSNLITCKGAKTLAHSLKETKLISLNISSNRIEDCGVEALADQAQNTLITNMYIADNPCKNASLIRNVMCKNQTLVEKLVNTFKKLTSGNSDNCLQFDSNIGCIISCDFLQNTLALYKMFIEKPFFVNHLVKKYDYINNHPFQDESFELSKDQILTLMLDEFPRQFSSFCRERTNVNVQQRVSLLRKVEEMGLAKLVQALLFDRALYLIDEEQGILHPYVYKLFYKYRKPIFNILVEPLGKAKLANYFKDHNDLESASDIVSLLKELKL